METIILDSKFITWKELGIDLQYPNQKHIAAEKWPEIEVWLNETMPDTWRSSTKGIWFLRGSDAVLFKLTWSGNIIR